MKPWRLLLAFVCVSSCVLPSTVLPSFVLSVRGEEPKLQVADLIARHLDSIGPVAAREAVKSRMVRGRVHMNIIGGTGTADGTALIVSVGRRFSMALQVPNTKFPGEQFVFDGSKAQVALAGPAKRSMLGDFIYREQEVLRDGLVGGTLLTAWPLSEVKARQAELKYEGLKKIDGRELHQLSYAPKKADRELLIHLYFEPETFRHVKTTYDFTVPPSFGHNQTQHDTYGRYHVEETFSDFQQVDGLTLPASWNLRCTAIGGSTASIEWQVNTDTVVHNNVVD